MRRKSWLRRRFGRTRPVARGRIKITALCSVAESFVPEPNKIMNFSHEPTGIRNSAHSSALFVTKTGYGNPFLSLQRIYVRKNFGVQYALSFSHHHH